MANCIKCGKELSSTKAFCEECLEVMEHYPVPSGTPLVIHQRAAAPKKASGKKKASPEEQVPKLKKLVKQMTAIMILLTIALGIALGWLIREIREPALVPEETKGQNYSTQPGVTTAPPTTTLPDTTPDGTTPELTT